jgi:hypothetical protein
MALANLRWKIETLGLHNYEVASAAKVSESKFSRVLAGRSTLSESERARIAETLGCLDHTWLFREFTFVPRAYVVQDERERLTRTRPSKSVRLPTLPR